MFRIWILLTWPLFVVANLTNAQSIDKQEQCLDQPVWVTNTFFSDHPWNLDFLDLKKVVGDERPALTNRIGYDDVTEVEFKVLRSQIEFDDYSYIPCEKSIRIQKHYFSIQNAYGYKKKGKLFALVFKGSSLDKMKHGELVPCTCSLSLILYDTKGDGKFDHLIIGKDTPELPNW